MPRLMQHITLSIVHEIETSKQKYHILGAHRFLLRQQRNAAANEPHYTGNYYH